MTLSKTLLATAAILALAGSPAAAQMYPGQDVIVNPYAVPASPLVLYPGGAYRQNPSGAPGGTIHLHMPVHHRHVAKAASTDTTIATATPSADGGVDIKLPPPNDTAAASPPPDTSAALRPAATPAHHKHSKPVETAAAPPPPPAATQPTGELPMNLDGTDTPPPAPPPPAKPAKAPTRVASTEPPPAQTTTAAPSAHADAEHANLKYSGAVLFDSGATDPSSSQVDGAKLLAGNLNAALEAGAARVQLEAYGGAPGDKSSDARRLSLKRALAVRQLLIDDGVPSARIDVRAMGGIDDKGPVDRVDVFVRAS